MYRDTAAMMRSTVKSICRVSQTFGGGLPLQVAGREVDAQPHLLVITVCETLGDALSHAVDAHHQLALVMHLLRKGGNVERVVVAQQRRVGFQEPDRLRGTLPGARPVPFRQSIRSAPGLPRPFGRVFRPAPYLVVQLLGVCGVIASYADDFHGFPLLFVVIVPLCPDQHPDDVDRKVNYIDDRQGILLAGQVQDCCK